MTDVRVQIDHESELAKRRPGASGFQDLLSGGCGSAANPYSLMSDFIDEAFEDCKLDDKELAGMKVLAGFTPGAKAPQAQQPSTPRVEPPNCEPPKCDPPKCDPPPMSQEDFMQDVGKKAVQSQGCANSEGATIDQACRLLDATLAQQQAFLGKLDEYIASGCEIDEDEARRLEAFVDGLLTAHHSATPAPAPHAEKTTAPPVHAESPQRRPLFDSSQVPSGKQRQDLRLDDWQARGGISPEVIEVAKNLPRAGG